MDDDFETSPTVAVAVAVIGQAMKDLYRKDLVHISDHVSAVCWLGSKAGIKWFDTVNIAQDSALPKLQWDVYAKALLSDDEVLLSDGQRRVLTETLEYFESRRGYESRRKGETGASSVSE